MTKFLRKNGRVFFALALAFALSASPALSQNKNPDPKSGDKGTGSNSGKYTVNPHGTPDAYENSLYKPRKYPSIQNKFASQALLKKLRKLPRDILNNCAMAIYKGFPRDWVEKIPIAWDLMKMRASRMEPTIENSMSFANLEKSYEEVCAGGSNYHCCWGHTTVTRKFSALAFFDKGNISGEVIPAKGTKEWHEFYHAKIEDIMNYKGSVIPGYENLFEFSSEPEIQVYLKQRVMQEWGNQALKIHWTTAKIFLSGHFHLGELELDTLLNDLDAELAKGYNPKIYFTAAGASMKNPNGMAIHVVQVTNVERKGNEGAAKIWVWDISNQADKTHTSITIKKDGRAYYDKWDDHNIAEDEARLSDIKMTPENKDDAAMIAIGLFKFAQEKPALFEKLK